MLWQWWSHPSNLYPYSCVPNKSPPDFYFFSDFFRSGHPYKAPDVYLFFWYVLPGRLLGNRMIFLDFLLARTIFLVELQNFFLNQLVKLFEHQKFTLFGWVDFFSFPDVYKAPGHLLFLGIYPFRTSLLSTGLLFIFR